MDVINENESLFDLIRAKKQIKGKITIAQISGKTDEILALKAEYAGIVKKIRALETAAQTEGACIRIM
ncbi:MAG: hypothetical protein PHX61_02410 [Alphaproteobacteria bacterium]|nr:hypothetical protein [Alphaproteobacteria bacterium]